MTHKQCFKGKGQIAEEYIQNDINYTKYKNMQNDTYCLEIHINEVKV